jgi:hypothetical protein
VCLLLLGTLQAQHYIKDAESPDIEIDKARAYVLIESVELSNVDDDLLTIASNKIASVKIVAKNSGHTPATNVKHQAHMRIGAFPPPAELFNVPNLPPQSVFTLGAGDRGVTYAGLGRALNDSEKTSMGLGITAVYVFGEISYDSYGVRRCTHYRYLVGGNVGFNGVSMSQMAQGNYIDKNCTP